MGNGENLVPARTLRQRLGAIVPWLLSLVLSGAGAFTLDGVERAMAVGAFAASSFGALLAVSQLRRAISMMRGWMGERESTLSTFADDRAAAVARQFQWAVEELVSARAELRSVESLRAEAEERAATAAEQARRDSEDLRIAREQLAQLDPTEVDLLRAKLEQVEQSLRDEERDRRNTERRARSAEQRAADLTRTLRLVAKTVSTGDEGLAAREVPSEPITLDWTLEYDGTAHSLRLGSTSASARPSKARILDATGRQVAESASALQRRPAQLVLRIPPAVAGAVESGDWSAFQLEVEIDDVWHGAVLVDRAQPVVDSDVMQPRAFRVVS